MASLTLDRPLGLQFRLDHIKGTRRNASNQTATRASCICMCMNKTVIINQCSGQPRCLFSLLPRCPRLTDHTVCRPLGLYTHISAPLTGGVLAVLWLAVVVVNRDWVAYGEQVENGNRCM